MPKVMAVQEWKAALESGTSAPPDVILHKTGVVEIKEGAADKREVDFTISTGGVDREKDVINQEGWDLKHYKKSPVVLFAHDYKQPPIGRTTKIRVQDGTLKATVQFAPKEANPMAETVYQLVKGGFLSSASVGFKPQKHAFNAERGGVDFEKQELLEWSIVPVPANPEALMDAEGKGIDVGPLREWAKGILADTEPTPEPKAPMHQPGCSGGDCPGGDKCTGKALALAVEKDRLLARLADMDEQRDARLDRIEMALVKLVPEPVETLEPDDAIVFRLIEDDPEPTLTIDETVLRSAIDAAIAAHVSATVRTAVNALTGRLD